MQNSAAAASLEDGSDASRRSGAMRSLLEDAPGGKEALDLLETSPHSRPEAVGAVLADAYGMTWASSTKTMMGAELRAWAAAAGVPVQRVPRREKSPGARQGARC